MENGSNPFGLRWTGHPVIDMGVGAVTVAVGVDQPEDVSSEQWSELMDRLKVDYADGLFDKPSNLLTHNGIVGYAHKPHVKESKIAEAFQLCQLLTPPIEAQCVFMPENYAVARIARDMLPMALGRSTMNFYPHGDAEIPISSVALGCLLSLPLVAPVVSGRVMIVAIDNRDLFLELCQNWHEDLQSDYGKMRLGAEELTDRKAPRSRLVEVLEHLLTDDPDRRRFRPTDERNFNVTLYHITNSGQGPGIDIYTVQPNVNRFLARAQAARYKQAWNALTGVFWRNPKGKLEGAVPVRDERLVSKNDVYEALAYLPDQAPWFIRRFFLGYARNRVGEKSDLNVADVDMWDLLHLFLTEVMDMTDDRIEKIKTLTDELALEISDNNDKALYRRLMGIVGGRDSYGAFRQLILRAVRERLKRENRLLLTLDDYLQVFEEAEEFPHGDWRLARDLIRLRCLERLYELNYFEVARELLDEAPDEEPDEVEV